MINSKHVIGTGALAGLALALKYQSDQARKEFDPIESGMNAVEDYILDPVDNLSGKDLAMAAGLAGLGGVGLYQGYQHRDALRDAIGNSIGPKSQN